MWTPERIRKIIKGLFSRHWRRVVKVEVLKVQTHKYRLSVILRKYWIEGDLKDRGEGSFYIHRKRKYKGEWFKKKIQVFGEFGSFDEAEETLFSLGKRTLSIAERKKEWFKFYW